MGLNEVHVNIQPMTRLDRLQLLSRIIRACEPPLNRRGVDEGDDVMNPAWEAGAALP